LETHGEEAMIIAIIIIAAIVVVFFKLVLVFVFVGGISTMDGMLSNDIKKEKDEFHLWIPLMESINGIRL
jgi:hypothetical protein